MCFDVLSVPWFVHVFDKLHALLRALLAHSTRARPSWVVWFARVCLGPVTARSEASARTPRTPGRADRCPTSLSPLSLPPFLLLKSHSHPLVLPLPACTTTAAPMLFSLALSLVSLAALALAGPVAAAAGGERHLETRWERKAVTHYVTVGRSSRRGSCRRRLVQRIGA